MKIDVILLRLDMPIFDSTLLDVLDAVTNMQTDTHKYTETPVVTSLLVLLVVTLWEILFSKGLSKICCDFEQRSAALIRLYREALGCGATATRRPLPVTSLHRRGTSSVSTTRGSAASTTAPSVGNVTRITVPVGGGEAGSILFITSPNLDVFIIFDGNHHRRRCRRHHHRDTPIKKTADMHTTSINITLLNDDVIAASLNIHTNIKLSQKESFSAR